MEFVGYRIVKGEKEGRKYCFTVGVFLVPVDSQFGSGFEPFMRKGRLPVVSGQFMQQYKIGTVFSHLLFDENGSVVSGLVEE